MKGVNIVVKGNVGHMSAFMAQAGTLVVAGDAAADLGDSIYEAEIYVGGSVDSLGSDCVEKEIGAEETSKLSELLGAAGIDLSVDSFRRFGSARELYNFHVDDINAEISS